MNTFRLPGVLAVETSGNSKLGPVSATYVAQPSCPRSCPYLDSGCYAEHGTAGFVTRRLNREAAGLGLTPEDLAAAEAEAVGELSGRSDLRLHVVGDCVTAAAAAAVSHAARRFLRRRRRKRRAWGYTHAWQNLPREAWAGVSMLASCGTLAEVERANGAGYAASLVVGQFQSAGVYRLGGGLRLLPCPEEARPGRGVTCLDCQACFDDAKLLKKGLVIGFIPRGQGKKKVPLPVLPAGGERE